MVLYALFLAKKGVPAESSAGLRVCWSGLFFCWSFGFGPLFGSSPRLVAFSAGDTFGKQGNGAGLGVELGEALHNEYIVGVVGRVFDKAPEFSADIDGVGCRSLLWLGDPFGDMWSNGRGD